MHIIHLLAFLLVDLFSARALEKRGKISDYVFGNVIGSGGFANILLATHTETNKEFAAKVPLKTSKSEDLQMFAREISFLKTISESKATNVIKFFDTFTDPTTGHPVLILEKANGIDLFDWIMKNEFGILNGKLDRFLLIRLMYEAAQSVKQVHDLDICHRDIKV